MTRGSLRWVILAVLAVVVQPVGASAPPSRYSFPTAGTVLDTRTGLTWQRSLPDTYPSCSGTFAVNYGVPGEACTWAEAKAYCAALSLDGGGWRLPTRAELLTLVDPQSWNPAIDETAFPNTLRVQLSVRDRFWSSTPYVPLADYVWGVEYTYGYSNYYRSDFSAGIRCVR